MSVTKKILIVDDDEDVILFLSTVLQDRGYEAIHAMDGKRGLEVAKAESPALILLDLMMPQKSGISLLADLKKGFKAERNTSYYDNGGFRGNRNRSGIIFSKR